MKKILGIGNALVDILIQINDDQLLSELNLDKGSMSLIDTKMMNNILERTIGLPREKFAGGSVANTIHGLSILGVPTGYIGKIGSDEYGEFFKSYMSQKGIQTSLFFGKQNTGKSFVLISKDSERTMATFLGSAIELEESDLHLELFQGYEYFQLEGYLVQNHKLVHRAAELSREANNISSIDLGSFNIVEENLDFLHYIINKYIDIVFSNEEEARVFTGEKNPEAALTELAKKVKLAIVKLGKEGSLIGYGNERYKIESLKTMAIDTTGAGDLYASGFFYGLSMDYPIDLCGKIGSIVSGNIVDIVGTKMNQKKWEETIQLIRKEERKLQQSGKFEQSREPAEIFKGYN
jgi:sugar/nucleoside kinase (ribokinase family)